MLGDIIFNGLLAVRYGIAEAILLRMLVKWLDRSSVDSCCYEKAGLAWVRLTVAQMQADLPFFSPYRIRSALDNLIYEKLITTDEEQRKVGLRKRKTVAYAFTDKGEAIVKGKLQEGATP